MARALTISEANARLFQLGYRNSQTIEANELTPGYITHYYYQEVTNMFDKEGEYRWWEIEGTRLALYINENPNGRRQLSINYVTNCFATAVVNYAKLNATDKKKFMEIFEALASRKQTYIDPNTRWGKEITVYGDALPLKYVELEK